MNRTLKISNQYTKTLFGNIPNDWRYVAFEDALNGFSSGSTPSRNVPSYFDGEVLWITSGELNYNVIYDTKEKITQEAVKATNLKILKPGTFLFAITGLEAAGTRGSCAIVGREATTNQSCMALTPKPEIYVNYFFYYYCHFGNHLAFRFCQGTKQQSYNGSIARKLPLILPPLPEQQKIAKILSTWDLAISTMHDLIDELKLRNKGLAQQLLTGKKRLKGFDGEWKDSFIGDCARNMNIRNKGKHGTDKLFAVTKKDGMIPMREHVKGSTFENCKIVRKNWFAYNPMRINIGSIALWNSSDEIMVSGDYVVFECDEQKLLPQFLEYLRKSILWENYMLIAGNGSVRIRIYFKELAHFKLPLPPLNEQKAILNVLDKADKELKLYQQQLHNLKEQKKGLMQKLLTGEIRVNV